MYNTYVQGGKKSLSVRANSDFMFLQRMDAYFM